jgi:hypothetical protein
MLKDKIEKKIHKKSKKKLSQPEFTRRTCDPIYEIEITPQKRKWYNSWSLRLNSWMSNDESKKKKTKND